MAKQISVLLILACLVPSALTQQRVREKAPESTSETEKRKAEDALRKTEAGQRKAQAVDILKGVVDGAAEIQHTPTRVAILTGAFDLLWKHDEAYARANFIKAVAVLSDRFASDATPRAERSEIRSSIGVLLMAFARHDPRAAERLQEKFQQLVEDVSKGNLSPSERLSLAQASLDSDATQSVALAARVLETGVPGSFPSYLNELEQRNAGAAASLCRVAISVLSAGHVYTPVHATVLSTYIFRESQMSVPMAQGGRDGVPLEFGTFASPLSPPTRDLNLPLVAAYLNAAGAYLNTEAIGLEQQTSPDAVHIALNFFLVKKLWAYAERLDMNTGQNWPLLDAKYTFLAERAKLSDATLSGLAAVAQRIVTENSIFKFDAGEDAFAKAENVRDPVERANLLATGIRQQIDDGKYTEAVQKIAALQDDKFREQLNSYLAFRVAETSIKKGDWYSFNSQVNRVSDLRVRTYLTLSAAVAASDAGKKKICSDFLLTAMGSFPRIEEADTRAAALVTTAGILYRADASWAAQVLTEAISAINRGNQYDGGLYGVGLELPRSRVWLTVANSDLSHCFEQAAKHDWTGALAAARGIESKALRSQAYIAACRSVL